MATVSLSLSLSSSGSPLSISWCRLRLFRLTLSPAGAYTNNYGVLHPPRPSPFLHSGAAPRMEPCPHTRRATCGTAPVEPFRHAAPHPFFVLLTGATPPRIATPLNARHPVLRPPHGWNPPAPHPYRELPGGTDTSQHVTDTSPFFPDSPCWCLTRGFSRNPLKSWDRRVLALAV